METKHFRTFTSDWMDMHVWPICSWVAGSRSILDMQKNDLTRALFRTVTEQLQVAFVDS